MVLPPESQSMVPPVAKVVELTGCDPPPVSPPVHPLTVEVPEAVPEMVLQEIVLVDHLNLTSFNVLITPLVEIQTSPLTEPGISMPSPVSPVTVATKRSAEGSLLAFLT